jgi:hypothetical protein
VNWYREIGGASTFHFEPEWGNEHLVNASVFWVYSCQVESTLPVYRYITSSGKSTFHFAPAWQGEHEYNPDPRPIFYAFPKAVPNIPSEAVVHYTADGDQTIHFPPGLKNEVIAAPIEPFYAFKSPFCGWPAGGAENRNGSWVVIGSSMVDTEYDVEDGIITGTTEQRTESWGDSTTLAVENDFMFFGFGFKITVSHTWSHEVAQSFSQSFQHTHTETWKDQFPPGVYWQFQFTVDDSCGTATIGGHYVAVTQSEAYPPCCLPGFSVSPKEVYTCTSKEVMLPAPHCKVGAPPTNTSSIMV